MARKTYTAEQVIAMLREAEVQMTKGGEDRRDPTRIGRIGAELLPLPA